MAKMIEAAEALVEGQTEKAKALMADVYGALVEASGCRPDVKTIYISFTKDDCLVASAHPGPDGIELALALPENHPSPLLADASHLTWRTLPLLVSISESTNREDVMDLVYEAMSRIESGEHDVDRPPEYFRAARRAQRRSYFWEAKS